MRILLDPQATDVGQGVFETTETTPSTEATQSTPAQPTEKTETTATPPAQTQGMSKEEIATIVQEAARAVQPKPQPQQMTQEDFNRAMNVFIPNEELVTNILKGGQEAVQALAQIVQGVVRQATTMSAYQAQLLEDKLTGRLSPLEVHYQQAYEAQLMDKFLGENTDLKGFENVIKHVVTSVKQSGKKFANEKEAFKHVADETRAFLKTLPGVTLGASGQGQQGQAQQPQSKTGGTATMSALSAGSQMSASGKQTKQKSSIPGMEVFD